MSTYQRREGIRDLLGRHGSVRTRDLMERFSVSEETIRKDLIALQQEGLALRVHGGARRAGGNRRALPLPERTARNQPDKQAIARLAGGLIQPRDTVFLDASSSVLAMTDWFPGIEATVLTNANHVVVALEDRAGVDLICTGGDYERRSRSYVGTLAEEALNRYLIQRLFVGVDGLDPERGASEVNPGQARLKERLVPMAEQVIVLADHTKLARKSPFFFAGIGAIDLIITDQAADPAVVAACRRAGVTVRIAGHA